MPVSADDVVSPDDNANNNSVSSAPSSDPKKAQLLKERAAKIFKQHVEIMKYREELKLAMEDKEQIEAELKARSDEVYEMNQKMIFLEFQKQQDDMKHMSAVASTKTQDLKDRIERMIDQNLRRVFDMQQLKKSLNRLKNDLYYFKLSKKLQSQANSNKNNNDEKKSKELKVEDVDAEKAMDTSDPNTHGSGKVVDSD